MVWRVFSPRSYALAAGVGLLVPGAWPISCPSPQHGGSRENALHTDVGLIYFWGALLMREDLHPLYRFGGMRLLLSSDKALIIGRLWCDLGFLHPLRRHRLLAGEYGALLIVVRVGVRPPLDRELISIVEKAAALCQCLVSSLGLLIFYRPLESEPVSSHSHSNDSRRRRDPGIDRMLTKISQFYKSEIGAAVKPLTSIIGPLMIVVVGGIIAMYPPMFEIFELEE